ncbi:uncharacterized protein FMAN_12028 [Fusarium mangiferae]|uniref:DUF7908 domain-containing protein n=1 Tax=Fusarium mangiferae TaxID=192010 RepID=A0A1L7UIF7_FUSMA|nr:uncharacterized protein FMAN_12028 [Fusarium mangiferae]CVL06936.1 uncharacterized protein FMAN_12028 [Fusarium mangiferae]
MRPSTIFVPLLGLYDLVLAFDLAEVESDVWCVTYLSTYLMPISNSIAISTDINSASTAISSTTSNSSTSEPSRVETKTTEAHSISKQISIRSSTLATTDQLNSSQIQTLSSTTLSTTDLLTSSITPTSSTTASSDFTATSTPQPSGRSIILQIQPPTTNRRRNIKGAPVGGFVGGSKVCTFALDFTLSVEGQLLAGGVPVFYAGEDFKPLSEQKPIGNSGNIITKTFTESNGVLVFKNSSLPTGEAGFCQTSNGIVYITFSSQPSGCVPVALRIYEVQQCQNGRIIDRSTTSSSATSTSEAASSGATPSTTTIQSETTAPSSESTESRESATSTVISSTSSSSTNTTPLSATVSSDLSSEGSPLTTLESTSEITSLVTDTTILTSTENATSDDISSIQSSTESPTSSATTTDSSSTGDTAAISTMSSKLSSISTSSTTTSSASDLASTSTTSSIPASSTSSLTSSLTTSSTTSTTTDSTSELTTSSTSDSTSSSTDMTTSSASSSDFTTTSTSSSDLTTSSASTADLTSTDSTSSKTSSETSTTTSAAPSLVQDGGFEDNPNTAWTLSGSAAIVNNPGMALSGNQYLQLSVVNGLPSASASQTGLVSSPNSMSLSYVVMDSPTPSGVSQCSFRVMTAGNLVAAFDVNTTPDVWQSESFGVWGSGSSWTIELYLYCSQGPATFAIGVDNVSIQ